VGVAVAGEEVAGGAAGVEIGAAPSGVRVGSAVAGAGETGLAVGVGPAVEKDTTRGVGVAGPPATVTFTGWLDEQLEVTAANASQRANPPIVRQTREFCIFPSGTTALN